MLEGAMPGLPRLGFPFVDVRDVADLHARALLSPRAGGERFLGTGDNSLIRPAKRATASTSGEPRASAAAGGAS